MAGPQSPDVPPTLSATDEDHASIALQRAREDIPPGHVLTTKGHRPYYPDEPTQEAADSPDFLPDNPLNPRGQPSLSLPQQATPLTSLQGVLVQDEMDVSTPEKQREYEELIVVADGLAPDDPRNPRGTPDYIVEEPSPRSNPEDQQHDGRISHTDPNPNPEPARYWEDTNPNAPAS